MHCEVHAKRRACVNKKTRVNEQNVVTVSADHRTNSLPISLEDKQKRILHLHVSCRCAGLLSSALNALKFPSHFIHLGFFKVQLWLQRLHLQQNKRLVGCNECFTGPITIHSVRLSVKAVCRTFLDSSFSRSLWAWAFSFSTASWVCRCCSFSWLACFRESRKTRISPFFIRISSSTSFSWVWTKMHTESRKT